MEKTIKHLKKQYKDKSSEIKKRLEEFKKTGKKDVEDLFVELCYCLCTPLSKAERVIQVINSKNKTILLKKGKKELENILRRHVRFHKNKSKYIIEARRLLKRLKELSKNPDEARDFLVENIKGLSFKEASHFLRNIGYGGLAIIDGHILNCLKEHGVLKSNKRPKNKKEYLEIENKIKEFAEKARIPVDELDLLFWSNKTGKVLK
ncbi:N-glycosylase/DNA lyase [Candidatus Woesearchaeota archaeon]|nr:N-glycosylase/DNA lyase [Candidatus Woesearchaeota archaeon]